MKHSISDQAKNNVIYPTVTLIVSRLEHYYVLVQQQKSILELKMYRNHTNRHSFRLLVFRRFIFFILVLRVLAIFKWYQMHDDSRREKTSAQKESFVSVCISHNACVLFVVHTDTLLVRNAQKRWFNAMYDRLFPCNSYLPQNNHISIKTTSQHNWDLFIVFGNMFCEKIPSLYSIQKPKRWFHIAKTVDLSRFQQYTAVLIL